MTLPCETGAYAVKIDLMETVEINVLLRTIDFAVAVVGHRICSPFMHALYTFF